MSSAALSVKVFGVYIIVTGTVLVVAPNLLLSLFGLPTATEIWIRVLGAVALVLGYYYWACGVAQTLAFLKASVIGRIAFCAICVALVSLASGPWQLLIFGAADVLGAAWTAVALRKDASSRAA
jgi:hypothetical protein